MTRLIDWRSRLAAYVDGAARKRFRPGEHDCAMFVAGAVKAMTGEDLAAEWRGQYRTLEDGAELMAQAGFADHVAVVAAHFEECPPLMARAGDIAVVEGEALGVVQGPRVYVLRPDGLGMVDLAQAERAFRV